MMRDSEREMLATLVQQQHPTDGVRAYALSVIEGPEKGKTFHIDRAEGGRVLIGTSRACAIGLSDPEVSRRHAALERVGHGLRISDLGSTNGTWIDRVRVIEAELQGDEYIRIGQTMLRLQVDEEASAEEPLSPLASFGRVVGASREMRRLYPLCERLANTNVPVIIEGETGTGKEALAESLHEMGPRAAGPFVVFDCTAVPSNLVESELFGHERGAFTGAITTRKGVLEQAHGGTLLIDEVGDLDLALQPKLLRAMERFEIRRVGGERWIRVDVRVLSATRRDLDHEVQVGRFRDDLFHRLAVTRIELPPLRHRLGDIPVLIEHFWREMGGDPRKISRELLQRWGDDAWPGNVRELKNAIARQIALGDLAKIQPSARPSTTSSPEGLDRFVDPSLAFPQARDQLLEEFEQRYVARVLDAHGGDIAKAAAASGIGRRYFQKLKARSSR